MKVFICGPARHGKDTVGEILKTNFGLTFDSSSHFCMRHFLREILERDHGLAYDSEEDCFADRVNHRKLWYNIIYNWNREHGNGGLTRLSRAIFQENDIYVGIRDREEFIASKPLSDLAVWVDAQPRLTITGQEALFADNLIQASDCDVTIRNDGTYADLQRKVLRLFGNLPLI